MVSGGNLAQYLPFEVVVHLSDVKGLPAFHQGEIGAGSHGQNNRHVYCNKQGGVRSCVLCLEALCLWSWMERQGVRLIMTHLTGSLNAKADELSRRRPVDR